MKYVMRFYGSCGHVEDKESKELFDKFSQPREVTMLFSNERKTVQNEVTVEGDTSVVHVHPDRYFTCLNCINESLISEGLPPILME